MGRFSLGCLQELPLGFLYSSSLNSEYESSINDFCYFRARKKAAMAKKPEVLAARRRKLWQLMVKKEMGKVQRTRVAAHKEILQNCKRMANLCTKHHRQKAMQVVICMV